MDIDIKKNTLKAWVAILYKQNKIDLTKYNKMILAIDKLTN